MTKAKYYQIRERADVCASVGIIKVENGNFPLDAIKEAIENHLDENIEVVVCNSHGWDGGLEIEIRRAGGETDFFDGEETWLYF